MTRQLLPLCPIGKNRTQQPLHQTRLIVGLKRGVGNVARLLRRLPRHWEVQERLREHFLRCVMEGYVRPHAVCR